MNINKISQFVLLLISIVIVFSRCSQNKKSDTVVKTETDYLNLFADTTIKAGFDFNLFSTGTWLKKHPIPADESMWGVFQVIPDEILTRLKEINEESIHNKQQAGSSMQKIADFWTSGMDSLSTEKQGLDSIKPYLEEISKINDLKSLVEETGRMHYRNVPVLFSTAIYQDEKISSQYLLHLNQGGLGLPDRDYYFDQDERTKNIRNEYLMHVKKIFTFLGETESKADAISKTILRMETSLAASSRKLADLRDPYKNYNKLAVNDIRKMMPSFVFSSYLSKGGFDKVDTLIVGQPEFFKKLQVMLQKESLADWKNYFQWHLIKNYADYLNADFANEHFHFYKTILSGTEQQKPRWKRVLNEEESYLGDALGQLYVSKYYSPALKSRHEKLVEDIITAYQDRIKKLDWMTDSTKEKALHKLNSILRKVGYPTKWKDYSNFNVSPSCFVANVMRGNEWYSAYSISKLNKPVDKTEWEMTPQTYNAYYNPSNNEIVLPAAAFIVPGIPEDQIDDALLYAYAGGSTIGHELTHAFDDQGSQFDAEGNLNDWWTSEDKTKFKERCKKIIDQFNNMVVLDSLHINGDATQGENIADLGGILVGLDAFKKTNQYKEGKLLGGYTPLQRYFFGWSLSWLGQMRDAVLALRIKTDVHSPTFLRTNGPVTNVDEWYEAFHLQASDKMYIKPEDRVRIW
jgi:putative endopeptidase